MSFGIPLHSNAAYFIHKLGVKSERPICAGGNNGLCYRWTFRKRLRGEYCLLSKPLKAWDVENDKWLFSTVDGVQDIRIIINSKLQWILHYSLLQKTPQKSLCVISALYSTDVFGIDEMPSSLTAHPFCNTALLYSSPYLVSDRYLVDRECSGTLRPHCFS